MSNQKSTTKVQVGGSALNDGLERFSVGAMCELLPANVNWGDELTPAILREILITVESGEREACAMVCERFKGEHRAKVFNDELSRSAHAIRSRSNAV